MMKTLLALLLSNFLLVPLASGQGFAQFREKMGHQNEQFRKHSNDDRGAQTQFAAPPLQLQQENGQSSSDRRKASDMARGVYPGRVLSIRPDGANWRVRMDQGGTVFNVIVDPANGSVVRPSE